MINFVSFFISFIESKAEKLAAVDSELASEKTSPDKWSKKEILGHLIDSALNNHRRFILALQKDNLIFDGYDQDEWVKSNNYGAADWLQVIATWKYLNLLIAGFIKNIPDDKLNRKTVEHNFNKIAFAKVDEGKESSLRYLIEDYFDHMAYHLGKILD